MAHLKKFLLWYPDPKNLPDQFCEMALPPKRNSILRQLQPNDYVDLTREEARISGGDFYFAGRYKLMTERVTSKPSIEGRKQESNGI